VDLERTICFDQLLDLENLCLEMAELEGCDNWKITGCVSPLESLAHCWSRGWAPPGYESQSNADLTTPSILEVKNVPASVRSIHFECVGDLAISHLMMNQDQELVFSSTNAGVSIFVGSYFNCNVRLLDNISFPHLPVIRSGRVVGRAMPENFANIQFGVITCDSRQSISRLFPLRAQKFASNALNLEFSSSPMSQDKFSFGQVRSPAGARFRLATRAS
jgi:hypothetical protein